ncbi:MAG: hypothetical protein AAFP13_09705 [Pseudomonadota bacterium]
MPAEAGEKIEVRNVNVPGHVTRVDRAKYDAMKAALLAVLPPTSPGLTAAEAKAALLPHPDAALFPGGKTAGWWMKTVQIDLEAQGSVARGTAKPLRFHRV